MVKFRMCFVATLVLCLFLVASSAFAQKARVTGSVVEAGTGMALIGANVSIDGTTIGAATDAQGNFLIGSVPPGNYTLRARYIGYETMEKAVQVTVGRVSVVNFEMGTSVLEMGEVAISAERLLQSQKAALNAQYESSNIKNVISSDLMGSFPDEEAVEAIARIPGVIVDGEEAIMRGMPADWALVTVNGEKIPAVNAAEDRPSSLQTFPIDLIQAIEVSKGQTADMDADAIAGNINFILKDAPSKRMFTAKLYRGYTENRTSDFPIDQFSMFGPTKASMLIGDSFLDGKLGYSIAGTFEQELRSEYTERWNWDYSDKYWGRTENLVDQDGNKTPQGQRYYRQAPTETKEMRAGFNTALVWKPSLGNKLTFKTFYSAYNLIDYDLELTDDYYKESYEKLNDVKLEPKHVMNAAFGGEHMIMGDLNLDYTLHYTNGKGEEGHHVQAEFVSDYEDRAAGDESMHFANQNFETEVFEEDDIIAAFNLKKPFYMETLSGYAKAGFKFKQKDRYQQKLDAEIEPLDADDLADPDDWKDWTITAEDDFIIEWDPPEDMYLITASSTDIDENYTATERIISAYAMTELWLGQNIMVLPGVRVEKTDTDSESRLIDTYLRNNPEKVGEKAAVDASGGYTDFFPSLNLRFKLPKDVNLRVSGSRGISRPSFRLMVGFNDYDVDNQELYAGNPELEPTRATSVDVLLEHYSKSMASHMSVGLFYKNITNVMEEVLFVPESGVFNGYEVVEVEQAQNVGTGIAQGIELSIQRQLDFIGLPEVGILANWTHQLDTYLETTEGERENLPRQADDVYNLALSYEHAKIGFSGRLSYQFVTDIYRGKGTNREEWLDARSSLDLSLRQSLNENVRLFIKGRNLLGEDSIRRRWNMRPDMAINKTNIYNLSHRGMEIFGGFEFSL
jgi:outer membrane receptor protein involved in Fe transport